jgi:hypothetical protein
VPSAERVSKNTVTACDSAMHVSLSITALDHGLEVKLPSMCMTLGTTAVVNSAVACALAGVLPLTTTEENASRRRRGRRGRCRALAEALLVPSVQRISKYTVAASDCAMNISRSVPVLEHSLEFKLPSPSTTLGTAPIVYSAVASASTGVLPLATAKEDTVWGWGWRRRRSPPSDVFRSLKILVFFRFLYIDVGEIGGFMIVELNIVIRFVFHNGNREAHLCHAAYCQ